MKGDRRRFIRGAVVGVAARVVAILALPLPLAETYENRTFDVRSRLFADKRRADQNIVAVVIDQRSLDLVAGPAPDGLDQGWPWPRDFHAGLVAYLIEAGARAVVFDFVFSERSIYTQRGYVPDDATFAEATTGHPVVQAVMLTKESADFADRAWPAGMREAPLTRILPSAPSERFDKATPPIPPLLRTAAAIGWIGFDPDDDGVARAVHAAVAYRSEERRVGKECRSRW